MAAPNDSVPLPMNEETKNRLTALIEEKAELVAEMTTLNGKLTTVKNAVRSGGRMPNDKYRQLCESQTKYSRQKNQLEGRLQIVKLEIRKLTDFDLNDKHRNGTSPEIDSAPIVKSLVQLREKYQQFSADSTRVSSMRTMASQFVMELNPIIKAAVSKTQ